jgi:hypothetical protein
MSLPFWEVATPQFLSVVHKTCQAEIATSSENVPDSYYSNILVDLSRLKRENALAYLLPDTENKKVMFL